MLLSKIAYKDNVSLILNGNNIVRVTSHTFLGVMIDQTLEFDVHVLKVCTKVSQS